MISGVSLLLHPRKHPYPVDKALKKDDFAFTPVQDSLDTNYPKAV